LWAEVALGTVPIGRFIMIQAMTQMDQLMETAQNSEREFFTFGFLEKGGCSELEFLGWQPFQLTSGKTDHLKGVLHLLGREIPVIDPKLVHNDGTTEMTEATCIVVFEHSRPYRCYQAIVVERVEDVMDIASKVVDCDDDFMYSPNMVYRMVPLSA
jgi:chemotaxis signal transduction protein